MIRLAQISLLSVALTVTFGHSSADAQSYPPPDGGWTFSWDGDTLDGWSHDNGSDEWDETAPGEGRPGGAALLSGDGTTYLRIQDTGDPRDHGSGDPGSNRKVYLTQGLDLGSTTPLDGGVTIYARGRVATGGVLDQVHPDGGGATTDWPAEGKGYDDLHDGGKGSIGLRQVGDNGLFSISLGTGGITTPLDESMPSIPWAEGGGTAFADIWIAVEADNSGGASHRADIYLDGSLTPITQHLNLLGGSDADPVYVAVGAGSTGRFGAIDLDFVNVAARRPVTYAESRPTRATTPS